MDSIRAYISKLHLNIFKYGTYEPLFNFLLVTALVLSINPGIISYTIYDMDEIWNYQFARRILYGFVPYKDFVMMPLPLSSQLNGWILSITNDELIIMRWIASSVAIINSLIILRILILIGKNHLMSMFYTACFLSLFLIYPKNNYSWYAVLFLTTALLFELRKVIGEHLGLLHELWLGIMLGLVTITKQNIGLAGLLASYIFLIYYSKSGIDFVRSAIFKFGGWVLIVGAEIWYLSRDVGFFSLLNSMYMNLAKFTGYAPTSSYELLSEVGIWVLAAFVLLAILASVISVVRNRNKKQKKLAILIALYSLANLAMVIPIVDWLHLIFGMPVSILAMAIVFPNQKIEAVGQKKIALIFLFLVILSSFFGHFNNHQHVADTENQINHYKNAAFPLEAKERIRDINKLILNEEARGHTVYFLNYQSTLYLIPLNQFAYRYDDIIGGGSVGETEMINKIAAEENITVIIRGIHSPKNSQETEKIEDYVRSAMRYKQSIHGFDVYEHSTYYHSSEIFQIRRL